MAAYSDERDAAVPGPLRDAWAHAAETAPSPRILQEWGMAATMAGDNTGAQAIYRRLIASRPPDPTLAWLGLAAVSTRLHEFDEARRAANEVLKLQPGEAQALQLLDDIAKYEAAREAGAGRPK
jgi:tetratricopeptide (TPR) repeat protein